MPSDRGSIFRFSTWPSILDRIFTRNRYGELPKSSSDTELATLRHRRPAVDPPVRLTPSPTSHHRSGQASPKGRQFSTASGVDQRRSPYENAPRWHCSRRHASCSQLLDEDKENAVEIRETPAEDNPDTDSEFDLIPPDEPDPARDPSRKKIAKLRQDRGLEEKYERIVSRLPTPTPRRGKVFPTKSIDDSEWPVLFSPERKS